MWGTDLGWRKGSIVIGTGSVVYVCADNLPRAWEESILKLREIGQRIATQYDADDEQPSIDATAVIEITDPMSEPRIHRCMPDSIEGLESYRQEVLYGIHDHWIDPAAGKWQYTYHERLRSYSVPGLEKPVDQIQYMIDSLKSCSYTRRAEAITWKPWEDAGIHDPACLQRIWGRVADGRFVMNVHMRSNDAYQAAFMNMYAFTELQKMIADALGVPVGRYVHVADSYHVYGRVQADMASSLIASIDKRTFEQRTFRTDAVADIIEEAREKIRRSLEDEKVTGRKGL